MQFVKQAPKFISDLLGIKDGGGNLMGMFKGEGWKQIGNSIGGLAGTALSAGGVAVGNAKYALHNHETNRKALTRALGGFFGAARRGAVATVKGEGWKGAYSNNIATTSRISHRRSDSKFIARASLEEYNSSKNSYDDAFETAKKDIMKKYQEQERAN